VNKLKRFRVREIKTLENERTINCPICGHSRQVYDHSIAYRIDEAVSKNGLYITLPGLYASKESAQAEIDKLIDQSD